MPISDASPDARALAAIVSVLRSAGCVYAEDEARLLLDEAPDGAALAAWMDRRVAGVPLEHIVGWAEFAGQRVCVGPGVFVPRRRTELLVNEALALLQHGRFSSPPIVIDLCCGSGAVGAAVARRYPGLELHAADIDPLAVECAHRNVGELGGTVYQGDLFAALPSRLKARVHLFTVNAPYVPSGMIGTMPPEARLYEAQTALDGGVDGLDFHRRVAAEASDWLAPGGHVLLETSQRQSDRTASLLASAGFAVRIVYSQELDCTAVIASKWTCSPHNLGH